MSQYFIHKILSCYLAFVCVTENFFYQFISAVVGPEGMQMVTI